MRVGVGGVLRGWHGAHTPQPITPDQEGWDVGCLCLGQALVVVVVVLGNLGRSARRRSSDTDQWLWGGVVGDIGQRS
jgi:hypothetical protein